MKLGKNLNITQTGIHGVDKDEVHFKEGIWTLFFCLPHTTKLRNRVMTLDYGDTDEERSEFYKAVEESLKQAGIRNMQSLHVIYDDDGFICAFKAVDGDKWIDVKDKFKVKTSKELGITFDILNVD